MSKLSRVCGHNCFPGGENCNGYCEGKADAPQTYDVSIEHLLNKVAAKSQNIDMLLLSASNEITMLREQLAAAQAREQQLREALGKFGVHLHNCPVNNRRFGGLPCKCGLSSVLALPADHSALDAYLAPYKLDAERHRHLRELPKEQAQAYFWNYTSRKQRDKAIDADIAAKKEKKGGAA